MFFSINFSDSFRFTGWKKGAGKIFEFSKIFFSENEVLEYAYCFFGINKLTSMF